MNKQKKNKTKKMKKKQACGVTIHSVLKKKTMKQNRQRPF
jgi:hypothetical protein